MLADRVGGSRTLLAMYLLAGLIIVSFGTPSASLAPAGFMLAMGCLGVGNGAVFQLVPQRFRKEIGVMTGLLGYIKGQTGDYQQGLLIFAGLCFVALVGLTKVKRSAGVLPGGGGGFRRTGLAACRA